MSRLTYQDKIILAPMVRVSTLPMRLLALDYGADIVYCEEIIDFKMLECEIVKNEVLGTVDFIWKDQSVTFRTLPREKDKLVFQIGTADAQRALKVAKMVEPYVSGIDVNMGCPKEFSIKGGMGAALMSQPDKIKDILTTLVQGLSIPVTCKTRILPDLEATIALVRLIASTGVAAVALHGRTRDERPRHPNHDDFIAAVSKAVDIPVIANGGSRRMTSLADIGRFREETGAASVMVARAIMWNPSILREDGPLPVHDVVTAYLAYAIRYETCVANTKYCVQHMMREILETPIGVGLTAATNLLQICALFDMEETYHAERRRQDDAKSSHSHMTSVCDDTGHIRMPVKYNRKELKKSKISPKLILYEWTLKKLLSPPLYESSYQASDQSYLSTVTVDDVTYGSSLRDKSKKCAEQAAAVVCLRKLGLDESQPLSQQLDRLAASLAANHRTENKRKSMSDDDDIKNTEQKPDKFDADLKSRLYGTTDVRPNGTVTCTKPNGTDISGPNETQCCDSREETCSDLGNHEKSEHSDHSQMTENCQKSQASASQH